MNNFFRGMTVEEEEEEVEFIANIMQMAIGAPTRVFASLRLEWRRMSIEMIRGKNAVDAHLFGFVQCEIIPVRSTAPYSATTALRRK